MVSVKIIVVYGNLQFKTKEVDDSMTVSALLRMLIDDLPNERFSGLYTYLTINEVNYGIVCDESLSSIGVKANTEVCISDLIFVTVPNTKKTLTFRAGASIDEVNLGLMRCSFKQGVLLYANGALVSPNELSSLPGGRYKVSYEYDTVDNPIVLKEIGNIIVYKTIEITYLLERKRQRSISGSGIDTKESETVQTEERFHNYSKSNNDEMRVTIMEFLAFLNSCKKNAVNPRALETFPVDFRTLASFGLGPRIKSVLVRRPYIKIAETIMKSITEGIRLDKHYNGVVTGTAGCGKSYFILYLLCLLAQIPGLEVIRLEIYTISSEVLAFELVNDEWIHSQQGINRREISTANREVTLIDPEKGEKAKHRNIGHIIVCCSASSSHFNQMMMSSYKRFYMPAFSLEELQKANEVCLPHPLTDQQLDFNYEIWGGIARYSLDGNIEPLKYLEQRLNAAKAVDLLKAAASDDLIPADPTLQGVLIHLVPTDNTFENAYRDFTSKVIEDRLLEKLKDQSFDYHLHYCIENESNPFVGGVRGKMFERVLKYYFCREKTLQLSFTQIYGDSVTPTKSGTMAIYTESLMEFEDFASATDHLKANPFHLHSPRSKTFPMLDFLFCGNIEVEGKKTDWIFAGQSTISARHGMDMNGARCFRWLGEEFRTANPEINYGIVFLVPSTTNMKTAQSFKELAESRPLPGNVTRYQQQTLNQIPQFVVKFDLKQIRLKI